MSTSLAPPSRRGMSDQDPSAETLGRAAALHEEVRRGHLTRNAQDRSEWEHGPHTRRYDLAIMDVGSAGHGRGREAVKMMRKHGSRSPITC